ncbi:MAG: diacylglycerol/lipid kinase family protein [Bacteroidota bacterium]
MKITLILNGISLQKKIFYRKFLPELEGAFTLELHETHSKNDAVSLASKAADQYVDLVLAAGGDGTINQIVNGMLRGREKETKLPAVGIIPIGSGNDFARSVGITNDPQQTIKLIQDFKPRKLDVGKIYYTPFPGQKNTERYFVNVADIGMGPQVVSKVLDSGRPFGSAVAYYQAIISTFASYRPMVVKAKSSDWEWKGKMRTLGIANGKYYGHGICIAPDAKPDDRMFSVFICGNVSVFDFIRYSGKLKKGKYVRIPEIQYRETIGIELTSESPCMIEGDGEILGQLPARVELMSKQLDFLI